MRANSVYKPYRCVPPHLVGYLRRFGLKTGIDFAYTFFYKNVVFPSRAILIFLSILG